MRYFLLTLISDQPGPRSDLIQYLSSVLQLDVGCVIIRFDCPIDALVYLMAVMACQVECQVQSKEAGRSNHQRLRTGRPPE